MADIEDLRVDFNAVLTSGGGSLTERQFKIDFRNLIGKEIPYKQLGFYDLKGLLDSIGGYYYTTRGGELLINAKADEKTAHIASLIARQKKRPGKPKPRRSNYSYYSRPSRPPPLREELRSRAPLRAPLRTVLSTPSHTGVQRKPPPPRFSNPPIIPQRQPLSVQARLENPPVSPSSSSILNGTDNHNSGDSNSKVPALVEEAVDSASFVDIQWLQAKVNKPVKPAENSSDDNRVLTTNPEPTVFESKVEELNYLASKLDLAAPVLSDICRKPGNKKPTVYYGKVKIGDERMSSFPDDRPTSKEAKELVAEIACEELRKRLNTKLATEPKLSETDLIDRIYQIVKNKPNGLFESAVAIDYSRAHNTCIPSAWLDTIRKSNKFSIENSIDQKMIIYPAEVFTNGLQSSVSIDVIEAVKASNVCSESNGAHLHDKSVNKRLVIDINQNTVTEDPIKRTLPGLIIPTSAVWDVYVASVTSNDIWVRLIGEEYDEKYNDVMTELEMKMITDEKVVTDPKVDEYYLIKCDSNFIRVQLREIISEEECEVFFVDNGESDTILLSDLRFLPTEYLNLPAQAIQCKLSYVDVSHEAAQIYLMNNVIAKSFVAEVVKLPSAEDNVATIILHNTNDENQNINVNNCILDLIIKKIEPPVLTQRHVTLVKLLQVEANTSPYLQIQGENLSFLENVLKEVHDNMDVVEIHGLSAHPRMSSRNHQKQFLCQYRNTWRRGIIVNTDDLRKPTVLFIDYGITEKVLFNEIFDIDKVLPPLKNFPAQAVQVNLLNLPASKLNVGVIHRLRELAPPNMLVITKCINVVNGVPEVELFKRVQPDNMIASINTDLTFNYEEYSQRTLEELQALDASNSSQRGSSGCTDPLEKYVLPPVNQFFDVEVSMSSNPYNFVVQPLEIRPKFDDMMKDLQEHYEAQHNIMLSPTLEELKEDATFAALHPDDDTWYRVTILNVQKILNDTLVSVRYADYGDAGLVTIDKLKFLDQRFRQIPALAIRAKLHGVKPKEQADWSVESCVNFSELVDCRPFVSKIMEVNSACNTSSWQLSIQLIDTSSNEDVNIGDLLVAKELAESDQ